jgi:hypothetical protein
MRLEPAFYSKTLISVRPLRQYRSSREIKPGEDSVSVDWSKGQFTMVFRVLYRIAPHYVGGVINEHSRVLCSLQQPPAVAGSPTRGAKQFLKA